MRHALELNPEDLGVVGVAGFVLGESGNDEEQVALEREAIRLSPKSAELHISLAFGLRQLGQFQDAEQAQSAALRLNDRDSGAHTNLGEVHLFAGNHDAARQSLLRAIELAPGATMKARVLLGMLQRAHDPHAAQSMFQAALKATDPYQSAFAASEMCAIALTAGELVFRHHRERRRDPAGPAIVGAHAHAAIRVFRKADVHGAFVRRLLRD